MIPGKPQRLSALVGAQNEYRPAVIPGKPQLGIIERFFVQGYAMIAERNITSQMATLGECDGLWQSSPHA